MTHDPAAIPPELTCLGPRQQRLALALAHGLSLSRAAQLAGFSGVSTTELRRSAWQAAKSPRVQAAIAALKASTQTTPATEPTQQEN